MYLTAFNMYPDTRHKMKRKMTHDMFLVFTTMVISMKTKEIRRIGEGGR